jgi:NAD(P)H-flavin reductase
LPTHRHTVAIHHRQALSDTVFTLTLQKPAEFDFRPGQPVRVHAAGAERDYSPVSAPGDNHLELLIRKQAGGRLSPVLSALKPGETITVSGPHGRFWYRESKRPAVFVAAGVGIAPFVSMARAGVRGFTLLQGARTASDLFYRKILEPAAVHYVPCLTGGAPDDDTKGAYRGRVTDYLEFQQKADTCDFYVCGMPDMVRRAVLIIDARFPGSRIFTESFG